MKIEGEIGDITYRNDENGYSVLRLTSGVVATGVFHYVSVGQEFELEGEFINNAKYGKQFRVDKYTMVPPNSPAKIRAFIGSGLIEGVGPVTAKNIVKLFGKRTLGILENQPEKLS